MGKFFVQNFGCRATQADGAALEALLAGKGLEASGERASADLVVLNTCTVTTSADDDVRQTIRRVHRENPEARILTNAGFRATQCRNRSISRLARAGIREATWSFPG